MRSKVEDFIYKCDSYKKNKYAIYALYRDLQAMPISKKLQEDIAIDFITDLLELKDEVIGFKYNAIYNVVCRQSKYGEFIPFRKNFTAEQLGKILIDRIFRYYRILKIIISDRDKLFISNYQNIFIVIIRIKRKLSTAYYL